MSRSGILSHAKKDPSPVDDEPDASALPDEKKRVQLSLIVAGRPSGYRTAPVAVPEICCLLFAAPDFDRGPSSSFLVLPQAAVGLVTQRATNAQKKTHRLLTMSQTRTPCRMKRKESRRELRPDSVWWLRELDLNQRPSGYEPDELPSCSIPRYLFLSA